MITAKIDNGVVYLEMENDDGSKFQKLTTLETFQRTIGISDSLYDSGLLPGPYGTRRIIEDSKYKEIIYTIPKQKRTLTYVNEGEFEVLIPNTLIYGLEDKASNFSEVRIFSLGFQSYITGNEQLYRFPSPNIYHSGGRVCWGDVNSGISLSNNLQMESVLPRFLSSEFNSDLESYVADGMSSASLWRAIDRKYKDGATDDDIIDFYNDVGFIQEYASIEGILKRRG